MKRWISRELMRGNPLLPVVVLCFCVFGMGWQIAVREPQEESFRTLGVETNGQIIALRKERRWRSRTRGARTFIVTTTFKSADGVPRVFEDEVSRPTFNRLHVGDAVAVRFVPGQAKDARLTVREHRASPDQTFRMFAWISGAAAVWLVATMTFLRNRRTG